ncbi:MAG: hypothetical protein QXF01_00705 [Candidatus Micrarchaeaceae archaeon]
MNTNLKETIGRAYFYTKLGYGNYMSWWLGAIAYITIIYELILKTIIPPGILTYAFIFFALLLVSFLLGFSMKRLKIYGIEHAINAETNPYIDRPIGKKEILNYENAIKAYDREINNYEINRAICQKLELEDQLPLIDANIHSAKEYKAKMQDMLNHATLPTPQIQQPAYEYYYNSFVETFAKQQYAWLAQYAEYCSGVYYLGAQPGYSAIYLAMQGYMRIYCYEPDAIAFERLKANTFNKINLPLKSKKTARTEGFNEKAPELFKPRSNKSYIIKCDVEGAEHKIFTEDVDLANRIALQIEYHNGPQKLPTVLEAKGFAVKVDKPQDKTKDLGDVGWIYASRRLDGI